MYVIISKINSNTAAIFLSHIQGFNALSEKLLKGEEEFFYLMVNRTPKQIISIYNSINYVK